MERVQHPVETLGDDPYTVGNWEGLDIENRTGLNNKIEARPADQDDGKSHIQ